MLRALRNSFPSTFGPSRSLPDLAELRERCMALLVDVPASDRKALLQRLDKLRRADDLRHLRSALFDTISRVHDEATARERIGTLDEYVG